MELAQHGTLWIQCLIISFNLLNNLIGLILHSVFRSLETFETPPVSTDSLETTEIKLYSRCFEFTDICPDTPEGSGFKFVFPQCSIRICQYLFFFLQAMAQGNSKLNYENNDNPCLF